MTVVGVVSTIRRSRMHDVPVARVYVPYAQYPNATLAIIVRARTDVRAAGRALQDAVQSTDSSLLVEGLRSVDEDLAQFVAPIRLITSLLGGFGVVGLLLAGLGVFGTMSYTVSQREREMAVRAALGRRVGTYSGSCSEARCGSPPRRARRRDRRHRGHAGTFQLSVRCEPE